MVYEGVCDDFVAARFSNNQSQNKPSGSEWIGASESAVSSLPDLNLLGGVSHFGDGRFGFRFSCF